MKCTTKRRRRTWIRVVRKLLECQYSHQIIPAWRLPQARAGNFARLELRLRDAALDQRRLQVLQADPGSHLSWPHAGLLLSVRMRTPLATVESCWLEET